MVKTKSHFFDMDKINVFRIILAAVLVALFLSFIGCKHLPPPIPQTQRDSAHIRTELRVDTFWRDRWHTEKIKGDTVFVHDSIYLEKIKYRDRVDSVIVCDSVPYPVEVPVRMRNAYDKFTARGFWIYTAMVFAFIVFIIIKWRLKQRFPL
jgi:hypothetical protein